jgi:hypothetical protein
MAVVQHVEDERQVHAPYQQGMRLGQYLQVPAVKQACLPRIFDLFDMHDQVIYTTAKIRILGNKDNYIFKYVGFFEVNRNISLSIKQSPHQGSFFPFPNLSMFAFFPIFLAIFGS